MMHKMMVSAIVGGLLVGYATLLYALVHIIVVINHSYLLSLASYGWTAQLFGHLQYRNVQPSAGKGGRKKSATRANAHRCALDTSSPPARSRSAPRVPPLIIY